MKGRWKKLDDINAKLCKTNSFAFIADDVKKLSNGQLEAVSGGASAYGLSTDCMRA